MIAEHGTLSTAQVAMTEQLREVQNKAQQAEGELALEIERATSYKAEMLEKIDAAIESSAKASQAARLAAKGEEI